MKMNDSSVLFIIADLIRHAQLTGVAYKAWPIITLPTEEDSAAFNEWLIKHVSIPHRDTADSNINVLRTMPFVLGMLREEIDKILQPNQEKTPIS